MIKQNFKHSLKALSIMVIISVMTACSNGNNSNTKEGAGSGNVVIPDSVVQFLMTSASGDFRNHRPPTAIDFRNVKIGYIATSDSEKTYVLCGEFLSKEENKWVNFTTIKTSGYEQYLGKTQYCSDATMVLTDEKYSEALKSGMNE